MTTEKTRGETRWKYMGMRNTVHQTALRTYGSMGKAGRKPAGPPKRTRAPLGALRASVHVSRGPPPQRPPGDGGALVSHGVAPAVPSARAGLTSGFGMGPGIPPPPQPPAPGARWPRGGPRSCGRPGGRTALRERFAFSTSPGARGRGMRPEGLGRLVAPG